ncbi:MAG: cytochrome P450 [Anaerolineae bacterium]|nr:cytochrome P450 [Anaerolineae bacterium]MDW8298133.1 cytochrome P450 [Anaerolineae bacterium]
MSQKGLLNFFYDLWREYGDLVRVEMGRNRFYLAVHPDHVQHLTVTHRAKYDKRASYDDVRRFLLGNGLVTSTGDAWRRQRRLLSPYFTPRSIEQFLPIFISEAQRTRKRWEQLATRGEPVEMINEMMQLTARIILRALFSLTDEREICDTAHDVDYMISFVAFVQMSPIRLPLWVPTSRNRTYLKARARTHAFVRKLIAQRRAMPVEDYPNDMLSKLLLARDEETGAPMSDDLVLDEAITMYFAGHETTARGLAFAWYALAGEPEVAAKLHDEIDRVIGDSDPTVEKLKEMPYTLQVLKETLRLYPPAPFYARDAVEDDVLTGEPIKAGTRIMLTPFCTHRHPDFWREPLRYDPERFSPEQEAARHPYAFHPFAAGQRICIGNNFSLLEMHVLLSMLAAQFAPRRQPGHQLELELFGTLGARTGVWMHIVPRQA